MKPIPKALMLRDSLSRKHQKSLDRFSASMKTADALLQFVETNTEDTGLLQSARSNHIVSLATAFEIHWREFIRESVDKIGVPKSSMKNYRFSFNDLATILGHRLTIGELIASAYTFQGIEPLQTVAREVFDFDFLSVFSKANIEVHLENIEPWKVNGLSILKDKESIDKCFEMRHQIVHDLRVDLVINPKTIEDTEHTMAMFCLFGALSWLNQLPNKQLNSDGLKATD